MRYCKIQYDLSVSVLLSFISKSFSTTKFLNFELPLANSKRETTSTYTSTFIYIYIIYTIYVIFYYLKKSHSSVLICIVMPVLLCPQPVVQTGIVVTKGWGPALDLIELHPLGLGPSIQLFQIPLQSLPALQQINTSASLGIISKLTEGELNPLSVIKIQMAPVLSPEEYPLVTSSRLDLIPFTPLSGPSHPASFSRSEKYTLLVCPRECCVKWCQWLY